MMVLKWMEEIQLVEGYVRSCLYDLPRGTFTLVDKQIRSLIDRVEGQALNNISGSLDENELDWLESFLTAEYIFEIPRVNVQSFSKLIFKWENASPVLCAVISDHVDIEPVLEILRQSGCKHLWINCSSIQSATNLLTEYFKPTYFLSIDIHILQNLEGADYDLLIERFPVVNKIYISNTENSNQEKYNDRVRPFQMREEGSPIFMVNLPVYAEAIDYNVYFNRKLNLESFEPDQSRPVSVSNIIDQYTSLWGSSKEHTDVCIDCEFRRMCIDKRVPAQRRDHWYHTTECNYNPYIAKWQGEEGYLTLSECGITSNETGFSIDHDRIASINQQLWGND